MKKQADSTTNEPATLTLDEQVRRAMEARGMMGAEGGDRGLRITRRQTCNLNRPSRHELERRAASVSARTFHG